MFLNEKLIHDLTDLYEKMSAEGKLPSRQQLDQYYSTFRRHFGPDVLAGLDGETLLETMHGSGKGDSLIYWLEFKNDEEFPAIFGSIGGGSMLKFGLYRRKETGTWMTGTPQKQRELSVDEAITIARRHRDQFIRGCELLEKMPGYGSDEDYRVLQENMDREAPDVSPTSWGHKYFNLIYPNKVDDYHAEKYQRFFLMKLLLMPPEGSGRYLAAGCYVAVSNELGMHMKHLAHVLGERFGKPHRYWQVMANFSERSGFAQTWEAMQIGGYIAIGWPNIGDLSNIEYNQKSKNIVRSLMKTHYENQISLTNDIFSFVTGIQDGDLVLSLKESFVLGIGRVKGAYQYDPSDLQTPHHHPVEWISLDQWKLPENEAKDIDIKEIKLPINIVEIERHILNAFPVKRPDPPQPTMILQLTGVPGHIQSVLDRKKQVILYGPPGTGKTYWARNTAMELAAHSMFGLPISGLTETQRIQLMEGDSAIGPRVQMCTFHPAYGYEDFLEGYRPLTVNNQLTFERANGIFKKICEDARQIPEQNFYMIIDEINRGDIPRIFGELLTVLEADKRNTPILLPISRESFIVPSNVYLIGTMNTADRSIALLDTALRRRFGFIELMPDSSVLGDTLLEGRLPLAAWLDAINERILENIGRDARNLQIGHALFLENGRPVSDFTKFAKIFQDDILPLLEEYCYEDYATLTKILGSSMVDENRQRIHHELFDLAHRDDLILALLAPSPDILASLKVVESVSKLPNELENEENGSDSDQESA